VFGRRREWRERDRNRRADRDAGPPPCRCGSHHGLHAERHRPAGQLAYGWERHWSPRAWR